jgi:hypothetical protein
LDRYDDFALVAMDVVENGLRARHRGGAQRDDLAPVPSGDRDVGCFSLDVRSDLPAAGLRTPIHRVLAADSHIVNALDFRGQAREAVSDPAP